MKPRYASIHVWLLLLVSGGGGSGLLAQPADTPSSPPLSFEQAKALIVPGGDPMGKAILAMRDIYSKADEQQKAELTKQVSGWIMGMIDAPVAPDEQWASGITVRPKACVLAGAFHLEEAIPSLIRLLSPLPGQKDSFSTLDRRSYYAGEYGGALASGTGRKRPSVARDARGLQGQARAYDR